MDSVYEAIGGMETFERLVHGFYSQVKEDDVIGPMYPPITTGKAQNSA